MLPDFLYEKPNSGLTVITTDQANLIGYTCREALAMHAVLVEYYGMWEDRKLVYKCWPKEYVRTIQ